MKTKTLILLAFVSALSLSPKAQNYKTINNPNKENTNGISYCLPQNDVVVRFKVQKTMRTKGIYQDYAHLLGVDVSKLKNQETYQIKDVRIETRISPNNSKTYFLSCDDRVEVEKTPFGTLKYIGVNANKTQSQVSIPSKDNVKPSFVERRREPQTMQNNPLPEAKPLYEKRLIEEGLLSSYPQLSPEKAVAEIKRLREKQIEILSASVEGTFMNTTIDYMYKQLDEMIDTYVALFIGTQTTSTQEYVFVITPEKPIIVEEDLVLPVCKFSATEGLLDLNDNSEGNQIMIKIHSFNTVKDLISKNNELSNSSDYRNKIEKEGIGVYYTIPETVRISIEAPDYGKASIVTKLIQYGTTSYTLSHNSNIIFDGQSGEILKMWK